MTPRRPRQNRDGAGKNFRSLQNFGSFGIELDARPARSIHFMPVGQTGKEVVVFHSGLEGSAVPGR